MYKIGNIDSTPYELQLNVYKEGTYNPKACISMPDDFKQTNELMSEHYLQFSFNYPAKIDFVRTDYIDYDGIRYMIRTDCQPTENNTQSYKYEPKFEAPEMFWLDFICFYIYQGLKESEWTLMEKADKFLQIACDNINAYTGERWTVGVIDPTDMQNLTFNSQNVFDMLTDVAEAFGCEWYPDYTTKTINLVGNYSKGDIIPLRREIELIDITRSNENSDEYCTRMYAFGSTRNIPTNYRSTGNNEIVDAIVQKRLRLPVSNGDYIDAFPNMAGKQIVEKVFIFESIYPKRTGTITALRTETVKNDEGKAMTVFYFKDSGLSFSKDYILPGLTLMLQFGENSFLSGRDFELGYNDDTEEFEIINNQDNPDLIIPNDLMCPRVGDFYVLYNFDISLVGNQYVGETEQELLAEAQEKMQSILEDNATYTCKANPYEVAANGLDLELGQAVKLQSIIFDNGEKISRIRGFNKYPATCKDEYIVGEKPKYSRLKSIDNTITENKKASDMQYLEAMKLANANTRSVKGLNYLRTALQNETVIDKGLLLTTLIQMGLIQGDVWVNTSGMSGIYENANDIFLWGGGTIDQANNLVANPYATENVANFVVTHGGQVIINQAIIRGKFESNENGNRIVINPETRSLKMFAGNEKEVFDLSFNEGANGVITSQLKIQNFLSNGDVYPIVSEMSGSGLNVSTLGDFYKRTRYSVSGSGFKAENPVISGDDPFRVQFNSSNGLNPSDGDLTVRMKYLSTNAASLSVGDLYVDSNGFIKMKI